MNRAITLAAAALALAGCSSSRTADAPTTPPTSPGAASESPSASASASLSRDAQLAVEKCTSAITPIGVDLADLDTYAKGDVWDTEPALAAISEAMDACKSAQDQVTVDGYKGAAVMLSDQVMRLSEVQLILTGNSDSANPKAIAKYVKYFQLMGPAWEWESGLKSELGMS